MKTSRIASTLIVLLLSGALGRAVERYVSLAGGHVPPFTNWLEAATNIQDAIDAASAGDEIWVTNGVYAAGGKVMAGDLTNRVALDKALTVQSVNGPSKTIIQGQSSGVGVNGPDAVRCGWLTNGALLSGFTIQGGATRTNGDSGPLQSGGGVWCASTNAVVTNCIIMQNSCPQVGGGAYSGTLNKCLIRNNSAQRGGGAGYGILKNCYVTGNTADRGGGVYHVAATNCALFRNVAVTDAGGSYSLSYSDALVNCTLAENRTVYGYGTGGAGGGSTASLLNCILWNNQGPNYDSGSYLTYCCTYPLPSGTGNISTDPQLLADGAHLASTSPCRGAGSSSYATGTDIDGQNWAATPAIGCDEWYSAPLIIVPPKPRLTAFKDQVNVVAAAAGQEPFYFGWSKDGAPLDDGPHYAGTHTASLVINGFGLGDAGEYQVVVTNAVGLVTNETARIAIHCVDALGAAASSPYTNWATAAMTIQDAIETAALTDVVLVTNGVYADGGKVKSGGLTNRVALDKTILVTSVNGPTATIIQGQWDPTTTNGPQAIRCAWLADGAGLSGFKLRDGATSNNDDKGGGAYCSSTNAELFNCIITNCRARLYGGGVYKGTLNRCTLAGNAVYSDGGGAYHSLLLDCLVTRNYAKGSGGGVRGGWLNNCVVTENYSGYNGGGGYSLGSLINCTVIRNSAANIGGGLSMAGSTALTNCIVYFNQAPTTPNVSSSAPSGYTCTSPLRSDPGNISADPQLVDDFHLAVTSPCRGMGSSLAAVGADIDGEAWADPPSMGCDEVWESGLIGPLSVSLTAAYPEVAAYGVLPLTGQISGRAARLQWSFGDGSTYTNLSYLTSYLWTNAGDYTVTLTAFNTDNPSGVSNNLLVHVVPLLSPLLTVGIVPGTNFSLSFPGQPGVTYVVEQATNLTPPAGWQTVQTLTSTGALMQVTVPNPTDLARFYRARTL